jgi:hypothetical protein
MVPDFDSHYQFRLPRPFLQWQANFDCKLVAKFVSHGTIRYFHLVLARSQNATANERTV